MIAIKIGTTRWRAAESLAGDEVEFTGTWITAPDGTTAYMVWDDLIHNCREFNAQEYLDYSKDTKTTQINAEAQGRITYYWPLWAQNDVALGVYSELDASYCRDWIAENIAASNVATDQVALATTIPEVAAVTVNWPVYTAPPALHKFDPAKYAARKTAKAAAIAEYQADQPGFAALRAMVRNVMDTLGSWRT